MTDLLALITIILWPVIPLFWIPVHYALKIFKNFGLFTYLMSFIIWLPLAYFIYKNRYIFLQFKIDITVWLNILGIIFLAIGMLLHIWTAKLLGLWGIIGVPEISDKIKGKLVTEGPFSIVRHPTYLAHTLMFSGIFLITGVISVGILTLLDIFIIQMIIIPLEEKEMIKRFGDEYVQYRMNVPSRFLPLRVNKKIK